LAVLIHVELLVRLPNVALSVVVEFASQGDNEFVEAHVAVSVGIKGAQHIRGLLLGETDAEGVQAPEEFLWVDLSIAIFVNGLEELSDGTDAQEASFLQKGLNICNNVWGSTLRCLFNRLSEGRVSGCENEPGILI